MTIRQQGGVFGRNPTFNTADIDGELKAGSLDVAGAGSIDGPVLVGTGTAEAGLHVDQNVGGIFARFKRLSSQYMDLLMTSGATQLYAYGKTFQVGTGSDNEVVIRQNNFSRMTFETNGDVTVEGGNLIIGTSGKGIDFSATSGTGTSELFDDYEEGTWTPEFADASSGGNVSPSQAGLVGTYTKIGNLVVCRFKVLNINTTGMTAGNDFFIRGFPFLSEGTTYNDNIGTVALERITFTGAVALELPRNETYARLVEYASGADDDYITVGEVTTNLADITATICYTAA